VQTDKRKIGGHLRTAEGLRFVAVNARALGYRIVQIMVGGDHDYQPYDIPEDAIIEYRKMIFGIETYVHLPYIINPCEENPKRRNFYRWAFREFAKRADALGAKAVVIHPGYKKSLPAKEAEYNLLKFMEKAYDEEWKVKVFLEVDAGSKNESAVGSPELIRRVLTSLGSQNFWMCADTCHLYARGVSLWDKEVRSRFLDDFQHWIRLVHLNCPDLDVSLGSNRDRHNTPFEERKDLDHGPLIKAMMDLAPCILERRSLAVQEKDMNYVAKTLHWLPKNEENVSESC